MARDVQAVLADALDLTGSDRGELAARLLESLDETNDQDAELAWRQEIETRLAELRDGTVKSVPWLEARQQIMDDAP